MKTNFKKTLCALISVTFIFNIMSVVPAAAEQVNVELTESVSVSQDDLPSSDKLLSEYIKRKSLNELYRVQPLSTTQAGDNLPAGSVMRNIYDDLKERIIAIASGTASDSQFTINDLPSLSWTAAELGVPQIIENGKITQQAMQAAAGKLEEEIDISRLLSALTADCPFELFWFDKVEGMVVSYSISADSTTFRIPSINFSFPVAYDYRGSDEYHVNESKVTKANAAAKNAAMVVEENEGLSDREKLEAYKDTICDLTDYNYDAAESTSDDYGDAWQMIYVFDNDSSTKVVCEGYSKAFQYLCDLSDFSTEVRCYSAAGLVYTEDSAYGHMWNVVRLDGRYYLADVTNCDDDYGRDYSGPFLVCAVENAPDFSMCQVDLFGEEAVYQYDADQKDLYVKGYLPLGVHEYEPKMGEDPTCTKKGYIVYGCDLCGDTYTEDLPATGHKIVVDKAVPPTCTEPGLTEGSHCSVCGEVLVRQETVKALGHKYNGVVTREPTSTQPGVITYTCSVCGDTYTEDIPATSVSYTYSVSDGEAEITGYEGSISGDITIPSELGGYPVTSIGNCAFEGCENLTSVTIPSSVTSIGDSAFYGCFALTSVTIPNSVTSIGDRAFFSCDSLTSVTIPNSVTSIGEAAFSGCSSLTSITIPGSVTSIGDWAFSWCISLTSVTIPNSVTSIGDGAFRGCTGLTSVTIPNSVTSIGNSAFECCSSLTSIAVDKGSTTYDSRNGCNAIIETKTNKLIAGCKNTVIPNSVTSIGAGAFKGSGLTSITIPSSVTSVGDGAFQDCSNLTSITIPGSVTSIGDGAFQDCSNLTSITIPGSVTSIGDWAFYGCKSLTSVTIPNSVTSIGEDAFEYCENLTSVTIPESVTSIGDSAFASCSSLTSITIPGSVTSIGDYAFYWCDCLTDVYYGGYTFNWKKIRIGEGNESLLNSKIHYKSHSSHTYKTTTVKKATTSKNGSIVKTCDCGAKTTTPVYYPKTFKLSTTSYTYDGKVKKPAVTVKDSAGKTISSANYTVTYASGRQYVGKYAVKVTFKGSYYSGSKMLYFNINPRNTSISKLTSGRKSFKVYLKKYTTQTTGYQIQYSTSSKFTGAKTVTVSNKTTAKTISKLYGGKRYYVRCRTYKKVGKTNFFSSWSGAKAVTTRK